MSHAAPDLRLRHLGATLHRTEEDFDTGLIYHKAERPMPEDVTVETVFPLWRETMAEALRKQAPRPLRIGLEAGQ